MQTRILLNNIPNYNHIDGVNYMDDNNFNVMFMLSIEIKEYLEL